MPTPPTVRERAWQLFDAIVAGAAAAQINPWCADGVRPVFEPDTDTLQRLLGVPILLGADSTSGVPALALDVWVAHELRRAGFEADRLWPRPSPPRVLPAEVLDFIDRLPAGEQRRLRARLERGVGGASSANILGKNYVKQVDVGMSSWATGPELLISTKRMDSSFAKNAANRVEESYGDAKNLRLRHPQAALGFVYGLNAIALDTEPDTAAWLIDLLGKLGREDDAYHAVALVLPDVAPAAGEPDDAPAGPLEPGVPQPVEEGDLLQRLHAEDLAALPRVALRRDGVPAELDPGRFFAVMCRRVLDASPVNFHREARRRLAAAR